MAIQSINNAQVCTTDPQVTSAANYSLTPSAGDVCLINGSITFTRALPTSMIIKHPTYGNVTISPLDSIHIDTITGLPNGYALTTLKPNRMQKAGTVECFKISTNSASQFFNDTIRILVTYYGIARITGGVPAQNYTNQIEKTYILNDYGVDFRRIDSSASILTVCNGINIGSVTVPQNFINDDYGLSCLGGAFHYKWMPSGGTTNIATGLTAGTYTCVVSNNSYTFTPSVTIKQKPYTPNSSVLLKNVTKTNASCTGHDGSVGCITGIAGCNNYYSWSNGATTCSLKNLSPGTYSLSLSAVQCNSGTTTCNSAVVTIYDSVPQPSNPICLVSVDSASTHNIIIWDKPISTLIDSFYLYRETSTNVYTKIASFAFNALSEYHDYSANPNTTSYKYELKTLDKCGNLSNASAYHNTIHLQNLGNGNFQWTLYEIQRKSNPVTYYKIYRDDNNTGNFQSISSTIPGGNSTYTDVNYASYPNAQYYVDVNWSISCTPLRAFSTTRSNIINGSVISGTGISEGTVNNSITIIPNPNNGIFRIETKNLQVSKLTIYNTFGTIIYESKNVNSEIDLSNEPKGTYFVEFQLQDKVLMQKLLIQ